MVPLILCPAELSDRVLDAAFNVHRNLGSGLLESIYEKAMSMELNLMGIQFKQQSEIPVFYRGNNLGIGFRADLIIENCLVLEIKAIEAINKIHLAQLINYLKLLNIKTGSKF